MTLDQLLSLEGIKDYNVWWYGAYIYDEYMNDDGLLKPTLELKKGKPTKERVYIIMSGEDGKTCRYRFAIKLIETDEKGIYKWERFPLELDQYSGRMVFHRESGFSFYNSAATGVDFILEEIWSKVTNRTVVPFTTYDDVELSFAELKEMVENHYSDYYKALSCVKGIYMIVDGNTGKLYVGSAYGADGIWGRWSSYAATFHGGNDELVKLYEEHGEAYFFKFKYIILQILPMKMADKEVIERESAYKKRYLTREYGLNNN